MATKRYARKRRYKRKNNAGLATVPRMMGRSTATKRYHGVDQRVFWFKRNGTVATTPSPRQFNQYFASGLVTSPPQSFQALRNVYDQYKILGMKMKFYPANVGIEVDPTTNLKRGNHCLWIDQRYDPNLAVPATISDVICTASARLINPRRPYSISIWRPKGKPSWGSCKDINTNPDLWTGGILYFIEDASVTVPNGPAQKMYFWTIQYKVVFRGRNED